jgi:hypothetical protein
MGWCDSLHFGRLLVEGVVATLADAVDLSKSNAHVAFDRQSETAEVPGAVLLAWMHLEDEDANAGTARGAL